MQRSAHGRNMQKLCRKLAVFEGADAVTVRPITALCCYRKGYLPTLSAKNAKSPVAAHYLQNSTGRGAT